MLIVAFTSCKKNQEIANALKAPALTNRPLNTLADGFIGYWPLAGNGSDMSGNGHTSTLTNVSYTTDHLGNANGAMLFDGTSSKMTIDDAADLHLYNTDFTISVWVRADDYTYGSNSAILSKRGGTYPYGGYMMGFSGTSNVKGTPTITGGIPRYYNGGSLITDDGQYANFGIGEWHNYIIEYNASPQLMFVLVDGSLVYYSSNNGGVEGNFYGNVPSPTDTNYPLIFGFDQVAGISSYFKGAMSDIRIYNRTLTPNEIATINSQPTTQYYNTFNFSMTQTASPYIDGNLKIKVNGDVVDAEYGNNSGTFYLPWVDVPAGTPFSVEAFTEDASSASNPMLTLTITIDGTNVFSQTIPAVPGASLLYNGTIYEYGSTYNITVTANQP